MFGGVQAETGVLAQQVFGREILLGAGEFHVVGEGLAQAFFALESEDVEVGRKIADPEFMMAVVEENARLCAHFSPSWSAGGTCRKGLAFTRVLTGESFSEIEGSWK
ncbi:hypothetical protein D9M71_591840 [compost metagenome]